MTTYKQTPSQTVGPYFAYGLVPEQYNFDLKSLFTASAADREVPGEHIAVARAATWFPSPLWGQQRHFVIIAQVVGEQQALYTSL